MAEMNPPPGRLSGDQISEMDLPDWRSIHEALESRFDTGDFVRGLKLVADIGQVAEELNHHPDLDLRYSHLNVRLMSHDVTAKTWRDVELARRISALAAAMGVSADPLAVSRLEVGLDTWDADEIRPFWLAVLGLRTHPRFTDDLVDANGNLATLWFQHCDAHDEPTQRYHLDLRVPPEVADVRIEAGLAAGGTLVSEEKKPRFVVLADPQGNKVCVCTQIGRSD
ncbi:4a-hydroxytetrahydrobiopterin dehydratase [Dermatophilaceae bacterium Sec6.4]